MKLQILKDTKTTLQAQLILLEIERDEIIRNLNKTKVKSNRIRIQSLVEKRNGAIENLQAEIACLNIWIMDLEVSCENTDI